MLDFAYQVKSCAVHSIGAIEGVKRGNFSPDQTTPPNDFGGLKAKVIEAVGKLEALSAAEVESLSDKSLTFTIGDALRLNFTGQDFLLSFSQPNFYFHVTTAYNILRMNGLSIGKADRSEEHTSELQSLMRISYAVFCLKKKNNTTIQYNKYT